jgi:thiol-disulfide isomerase/thioredoxin
MADTCDSRFLLIHQSHKAKSPLRFIQNLFILFIVFSLINVTLTSSLANASEEGLKHRLDPDDRPTQTIRVTSLLKDYVKGFLNSELAPKDFFTQEKEKIFIFFASYCSYCEAEIPHLNAAFESLSRCGLQLVGVSMDESWDKAKQVGSSWGIRFPYFYDENRRLSKFLKVRRIPHFAFTDKQGMITFDTSKIDLGNRRIKQKLEACNTNSQRGS